MIALCDLTARDVLCLDLDPFRAWASKIAVVVKPEDMDLAARALGDADVALAADSPHMLDHLRASGYALVRLPAVAPRPGALYGADALPTDAFGTALAANFRHFVALQDIMEPTRDVWRPCGSYLMGPESMAYEPCMHPKQVALFEAARDTKSILEIGVHGGHSLLIMLLASAESHITAVDLGAWEHTAQCVAYLQREFPGRITFVKGDSAQVLPMLDTRFDLIHVDGSHTHEGAKADMIQAHRLSHPDTTFVFDDLGAVHSAIEELSDKFVITHVPLCEWNNCIARRRD